MKYVTSTMSDIMRILQIREEVIFYRNVFPLLIAKEFKQQTAHNLQKMNNIKVVSENNSHITVPQLPKFDATDLMQEVQNAIDKRFKNAIKYQMMLMKFMDETKNCAITEEVDRL